MTEIQQNHRLTQTTDAY